MTEEKQVLDHGPETKFVWLDLEMTGLDPSTDLIIEVALVLADANQNELATYESSIRYKDGLAEKLLLANQWFVEQEQTYKDESLARTKAGKPLELVETEILGLLDEYKFTNDLILSGNTIRSDRGFIDNYWPKFADRLHYRMLDVSSFKIYFQSRYGLKFEKKNAHFALDDIRESIAELKHYSEYINADG